MAKRCGGCGDVRSDDDFNWRRREKGQRDTYCRDCRAEYKQLHYARNKERYVANAARRKDRLREENVRRLLAFLQGRSCADCREDDPLVLEFDHLGEKSFGIANALREKPWDAIEKEIAKCDVVCANCHRRRTAHRGGFARVAALESLEIPPPVL